MLGVGALLGLAAVLMLIFYLAAKEVLAASSDSRWRLLGQRLNVAVLPLFLVFITIVATRVADVMS